MTLSIVIPCLNEADTIAECVTHARRALDANDIDGEVIVVDNASSDGVASWREPRAPPSSARRGAAMGRRT